jgi:carbon monoxide dehydrogenase subunit G
MEISSTRVMHAAPDAVWKALNDPTVLKECIPGCESLERVSDSEWRAIVAAKVGPVAARFNGTMKIVDPTPPTGYTLKFEGQGGAAGFANGEAKVSLAPSDAGDTALSYTAKANVGGKLAQIGSRLIDGAAAKMADDFFARFAERVAPPREVAAAIPASAIATQPERSHWVRYIALAVMAILLIVLAARGFK